VRNFMPSPVVDGAVDLPAPVAAALTAFVSTARTSLDSHLRSIVLFGSGAENRLRPTSDVNVVVVLREFDARRIAALSDTLLAARAAVRLNVMWLLEHEIAHAAEAFAVKFADILRRRRVLWGDDPFESLTVPREMAIARLRQVLMNLIMRLRASYALHSQHEERLAVLLADAAGPLRASAAEILELEGSAPPAPREALEQIGRTLPGGDWGPVLTAISDARQTKPVEPGTAGPVLLKVIDLACHLLGRATALSRR
jgi:predicted nucleotidyltransferase